MNTASTLPELDPCDVPSTADELNRKVLEALSQMGMAFDEGQMSKEAFYQSLTAINLTTLGLIDKDVSDWISDTLKETIPAFVEKFILEKNGIVIVVQRRMATDEFSIIKNAQSAEKRQIVTKSYSDADKPFKAALAAYKLTLRHFLEKGFKVVK